MGITPKTAAVVGKLPTTQNPTLYGSKASNHSDNELSGKVAIFG